MKILTNSGVRVVPWHSKGGPGGGIPRSLRRAFAADFPAAPQLPASKAHRRDRTGGPALSGKFLAHHRPKSLGGNSSPVPSSLLARVSQVGHELTRRGETLATAESCTGGLLAQSLTTVPGASRFFWGGVVSYANEAKTVLLGVRASTLKRHGAVSASVAREMVLGLLRRSGSDHGIAITGVAGPSGGSKQKPVGRVYIAWAHGRTVRVREKNFSGGRTNIRRQSVLEALKGLIKNTHGTDVNRR